MGATSGIKITGERNASPEFGALRRGGTTGGYPNGSIIDTWIQTWIPALQGSGGVPNSSGSATSTRYPIIYGTNNLPGGYTVFSSHFGGRTSGVSNPSSPSGIGPRMATITASPISTGFYNTMRQWSQIRSARFIYRTTVTGFSDNTPIDEVYPRGGDPITIYESQPAYDTKISGSYGFWPAYPRSGSSYYNVNWAPATPAGVWSAWLRTNARWFRLNNGSIPSQIYSEFRLVFPATADYLFQVGCDDGIKIWIDNVQILGNNGGYAGNFRTAPERYEARITAGTHTVGFFILNSRRNYGFYFTISYVPASALGDYAISYLNSSYAKNLPTNTQPLLAGNRIAATAPNPSTGVTNASKPAQRLVDYFNYLITSHLDNVRLSPVDDIIEVVCHVSCHNSCHGSRGRR